MTELPAIAGVNLSDLSDELLAKAREARAGRAAQTLYGGSEHHLRQTVIALLGGQELAEHESPGEATLQVLTGHVRLTADDWNWTGRTGELVAIPDMRHGLVADTDSVIILTVATPLDS